MSALSLSQKATICRLAQQAYRAWSGREEFETCNPELSVSRCFEAWRRVEQGKAIGVQSLTDPRVTSEGHYLRLVAHFQHLLGQGGKAMTNLVRHQEEPRIVAYHKLKSALAERGLDEAYAAKICRTQFRCELGQATTKQLWCLFYTVGNRREKVAATERRPAPRRVRVKAGVLSACGDGGGNPF